MNTIAERLHRERVAAIGCVVCRRLYDRYVPPELHHIAEGSGLRSEFAIAPLCGDRYDDHHDGRDTGKAGFHQLGTKRFCSLYRVPGETEYGLLVWVNEDLAKYGNVLQEGEINLRNAMIEHFVRDKIKQGE